MHAGAFDLAGRDEVRQAYRVCAAAPRGSALLQHVCAIGAATKAAAKEAAAAAAGGVDTALGGAAANSAAAPAAERRAGARAGFGLRVMRHSPF